ncbi:SPOR domain-containing protein [Labrenzia sp. DG1229]|uniref:SPOR domain-containing protein n=1 Tax=Labrenzia sp. DG1229 TaxID=681847 RepID=UPI000A8F17B7|nr:SPOR domain-containing protein [Labrenzia sp. DG1229]
MEDPLLELARIVQKNKQLGANVSSGRVESTDYFAELDDFAPDAEKTVEPAHGRVEPSFAADTVKPSVKEPAAFHPESSQAPIIGEIRNQFFARRDDDSSSGYPRAEDHRFAPTPVEPTEKVSPLWPRPNNPQPSEPTITDPQTASPVFESHFVQKVTPAESSAASVAPASGPSVRQVSQESTILAPKVALDLEQNLTAELEDELIGALRQSVDEEIAPEPVEAGDALVSSDPFDEITEFEAPDELASTQPAAFSLPRNDTYVRTPAELLEQVRQTAPSDDTHVPERRQLPVERPREHPVQIIQPERTVERRLNSVPETRRPAIDESDFFAALNPEPVASESRDVAPAIEEKESPAGIDALFADLDFPERDNRQPVPVETEVSEEDMDATADDIDDMAWPAAANAVPQVTEEETPPPPEGYDLDAVARAMQESDPSLNGAGVLPPHSTAEKEAIPQAKERSRRGLYVTLGIVGVAALGGAGFFLFDGDAVQVPSGPPPVISGLQEPLKIYPEQSQTQTKILDRVNSTAETVPDRLDVQETPQPVELPPAPASTDNTELAPGTPKQVRTVIVRPDGTIVSADEAATATPVQPIAPEPQTPANQAPPVSVDTSRIVPAEPVIANPATTKPVVSAPEPTETLPVQAQEEAPAPVAAAEPAAPDVPAIVNDNQQPTVTAPAVAEPAAPVPTVLPRKKPVPPVQVASAPAAQNTSSTPAQADGPLNLNNAASAPTPAATTTGGTSTSGSIPSGTYIVQVTSQRSASAASDAFAGLQRRYPGVLGNRNAVIVSADLGDRGVYYRARIPTNSREDANRLCESLTAAGGECFVRRQQ